MHGFQEHQAAITRCISPAEVETCIVIGRGGAVISMCGFAMLTGGCKYETCPRSSPETCPTCGYMEEVPGSELGRCSWEPSFIRPIEAAA